MTLIDHKMFNTVKNYTLPLALRAASMQVTSRLAIEQSDITDNTLQHIMEGC